MISYRWGGVGWGGTITFMLLCTHRHSNLIIFFCCRADSGTALLSSCRGGLGWSGSDTELASTHSHFLQRGMSFLPSTQTLAQSDLQLSHAHTSTIFKTFSAAFWSSNGAMPASKPHEQRASLWKADTHEHHDVPLVVGWSSNGLPGADGQAPAYSTFNEKRTVIYHEERKKTNHQLMSLGVSFDPLEPLDLTCHDHQTVNLWITKGKVWWRLLVAVGIICRHELLPVRGGCSGSGTCMKRYKHSTNYIYIYINIPAHALRQLYMVMNYEKPHEYMHAWSLTCHAPSGASWTASHHAHPSHRHPSAACRPPWALLPASTRSD